MEEEQTMNGMCVFAVWMLFATIPLSSAPAAQPVSAQPVVVTRVKLEINGYDQVKQVISNVMVQQLRAIQGVQLVDANPQWTIKIETVVIPDTENKNVACIGLSEVVLEHHPYMKMLQVLAQGWHYLLSAGILQQDQTLDSGMKQVVKMIEGLPQGADSTSLSAHNMCVVTVDNLEKACQQVVTDFDSRFLRPSRTAQSSGSTGADKPAVATAAPSDSTK
jgi:hypothetical protein